MARQKPQAAVVLQGHGLSSEAVGTDGRAYSVDAQDSQLPSSVSSILREADNVLSFDCILPGLPGVQLIPQGRDLSVPDADDVVLALQSFSQAGL